jgi:hypothetical protein
MDITASVEFYSHIISIWPMLMLSAIYYLVLKMDASQKTFYQNFVTIVFPISARSPGLNAIHLPTSTILEFSCINYNVPCYVTFSIFAHFICILLLFGILFLDTCTLCSTVRARDITSHPWKLGNMATSSWVIWKADKIKRPYCDGMVCHSQEKIAVSTFKAKWLKAALILTVGALDHKAEENKYKS